MVINGYKLTIGASVVVSICPRDGKNVQALMKKADMTMYKIKKWIKSEYHSAKAEHWDFGGDSAPYMCKLYSAS